MARKKEMVHRIRGTYYLSLAGVEADEVRSLILRRRLQILVHSNLYYDLNTNLVSDSTWSQWANELVELQEKYPEISSRVDYHKGFEGFDGSSGFNLPYNLPEIANKARWLLNLHEKEKGHVQESGRPIGGAESGDSILRLNFQKPKGKRVR